MQTAWKNKNSNEQYYLHNKREKISIFLKKKQTSTTKHSSPSNILNMEFYRNFLFEYSLMGIYQKM